MHLLVNNGAPGKAEAIRSLLRARARPEAKRGEGMTPLLMAAATAHSQAIRALLDFHADLHAESTRGATALDMAWHNQRLRDDLQAIGARRGQGVTGAGRRPPRGSRGRGVRRAARRGGGPRVRYRSWCGARWRAGCMAWEVGMGMGRGMG